jgi:hypothetical protein
MNAVDFRGSAGSTVLSAHVRSRRGYTGCCRSRRSWRLCQASSRHGSPEGPRRRHRATALAGQCRGASHRSFVISGARSRHRANGSTARQGGGVALAATRSPRLHPTPRSLSLVVIRSVNSFPRQLRSLERRTELKRRDATRVGMTTSVRSSNPMSTSDAPPQERPTLRFVSPSSGGEPHLAPVTRSVTKSALTGIQGIESQIFLGKVAPQAGFEPANLRLTG